MKQENHVVIMAGGVGSRFWPLSTSECPKQFIDVLGVGKSLLQLTIERFHGICKPENMWIVTNIPEFQRVVTNSLKFTSETDAIVTLGIKPSRPETGYGYIQADLSAASLSNKELFRVNSFREKPDSATAQQYVKKNFYFWNAGIFIWNVNTIVNAFRVYQTSLAKIFESLMPVYGTAEEQAAIDRLFPECENISVDYAIMEKAEEIFVHPADFGWSDLGTWGSLQQQAQHDLYGNSSIGPDIKLFDSSNCIVHTTGEKKVIIQGLDGYVVAEHNNTLLICKLSEEQRIKQFID